METTSKWGRSFCTEECPLSRYAPLAANAALRMACAEEDGRNYKISHAPLAANAAQRMACAEEDGRNYKISHAPLAANAARGMACAIYKTKKIS